MDTLISLDPGGTTGYAILHRQSADEYDSWVIDQLGGFAPDAHDFLDHLLDHSHYQMETDTSSDLTVIFEQVQAFGPHVNKIGIEVIGAIKHRCHQIGVVPIPRAPSELQGVRKWPIVLPVKPTSDHEKDALHHAIVYLTVPKVRGVKIGR